jgi:hypothetical protein
MKSRSAIVKTFETLPRALVFSSHADPEFAIFLDFLVSRREGVGLWVGRLSPGGDDSTVLLTAALPGELEERIAIEQAEAKEIPFFSSSSPRDPCRPTTKMRNEKRRDAG